MLQQLAGARSQLLLLATPASADRIRVIAEIVQKSQSELLLPLAMEIAKQGRAVAIIIAEETGQMVFAQHPATGKDMQALLKQVSATFPAKGGGTKDFVRAKLIDPRNSSAALELAKKSMVG
jgi:alanyl-tRNA synthetase